jgi:hypothetical protein
VGFFKRSPAPVEIAEPEFRKQAPTEHPLRSVNYEPVFPRTSVHRRVLGHITPEVDRDDLGPRNTLEALTYALIHDDHTEIGYPEHVPAYLDALVNAGLATEQDGVYAVTEAGWRELMN